MNTDNKDFEQFDMPDDNEDLVTPPIEDTTKIESGDTLQDDIIRNDTIPETNGNTPGSSGAFPVGAFDTSKDLGGNSNNQS